MLYWAPLPLWREPGGFALPCVLHKAGAGSRPGGRGTFLCFAKEKCPKERRPCCPCPLRCASGQPAMLARGACRETRFALFERSAQTDAASQLTKRASCGARPPHALCFSARTEGIGNGYGNGNRGREAERSDGPCPLSLPLGMRLRRGVCGGRMRVEARMLRKLTCRVCPNGARQREVSFAAPAASAPTQVALSVSEGSQTVGSPFLCLLSFGEAKESECAAGRTSRHTAHLLAMPSLGSEMAAVGADS